MMGGMGMMDDFDMANMMDDFDSPFDFGGFGMRGMGDIFGNAERMMQRMHQQMENEIRMIGNDSNNRGIQMRSSSGNPGTIISKSYVSRVNYRDGKPQQEVYQSQAINQIGSDGRNIAEKQEAYKNSSGIEKASHQRVLDGRGQKCIRQRNRNTGEQNEHNIYKEMQESDLDNFNKEYNDYRNKCGFQNNYKALGQMNNMMGRMIGNGRRGNQRGQNNQPLGLPSGNEDLNNNFNDMGSQGNKPGLPSGAEDVKDSNPAPRWNTRRSQAGKNAGNNQYKGYNNNKYGY